MGWNGADLITDFSQELGDTSTAFKTKVLRWINEGIRDIATSHNWPFLREKGKAILTSGQDTHSLVLSAPTAPSLALLAGGSLTADSACTVLITYYEGVSGVESVAGTASSSATPTGANLSLTVSSIPVSSAPLVTARRVYLSQGGGAYKLYSTISDNTSTTTTITANASSDVAPPDESYIHMLDGDPFIEGSRILYGQSLQQLKFETAADTSSGTPERWAAINQSEIVVYPKPSSNTTMSFYYFKLPAKVVDSSASYPQLPGWLYEQLHDYVIWRGYSYRDRDGKESKKANYDEGLRLAISRKGKDIKRAGRVRSVTPDSDGYTVS